MTRPHLDVAEVIRSCYDEFLEKYGAKLEGVMNSSKNGGRPCEASRC
jgi:hypothetical protein